MSFVESFQRFAHYNQLMNQSVYNAAALITAEQLIENRGAYFKSVLGTLNHILVGDIHWFKRFAQHESQPDMLDYFVNHRLPQSLDEIMYADFTELRRSREIMDQQIISFTAALSDEVLASTLTFRSSKGLEFTKNFGFVLQHVFNHQTHHRGQVSTLLFQMGVDVGVTDFFVLVPSE
ncbi:putative damage-inducible protein DinB [Alteromonadaceae bacterium 2753L.S.0a.02]|nr:putative damage-inducible protein DinB [Alteromonadaceae bacterium 2753L.S.0a.02]